MPHRQKRSHLTNIKWNFLPPHQYLSRDKYIGGGLHTFNENVIKSRPSTANPSANPFIRVNTLNNGQMKSFQVSRH